MPPITDLTVVQIPIDDLRPDPGTPRAVRRPGSIESWQRVRLREAPLCSGPVPKPKKNKRRPGAYRWRLRLSGVLLTVPLALWFAANHRDLLPFVPSATSLVPGAWVFLWHWKRQRRQLRVRALGELLALTPPQFEQAIATLLGDLGYRQVRRVGGPGDLGAGVECKDPKGRSVVVQGKRHAPGIRVGSPDIQTFIGMMTVHHRAERGIFVTTSEFSNPAAQLAARHGIQLIDGAELSRLIGSAR